MKRTRVENRIVWTLAFFLLIAAPQAGLAAQTAAAAELVIADDVVDRDPVGASTAFPAEVGELIAWSRVTGAENTTISHVWRYRDEEWVVPLDVGAESWRTWSRKVIPPEWTGDWQVEVRDAEGNVLATEAFSVGGN